ncbi:hypothetical protein Q4F19_18930 [Sphingomonas sp. BIUV-7]|uniref:Protein ImuA n=1 Tax=Sphingomonas natans TaxID=3063330 RepID=A0ABT8YDK8_9SPHN|nr:hypothetical protein [Sphingomonas sp. BIUV-7]MDO6416466.1 hypothetical protein [Sphingomonas sp. BIUV-7]
MRESPSLPPAPGLQLSASPLTAEPCVRFALGSPPLDAMLGGGLQRGQLHEVHAASDEDLASMAGFALMLALRAGGRTGHIVWLAEAKRGDGLLHGPGVVELGADPARLLFVTVRDEKSLLKAAADVVRSPAAGTAVIAPGPRPRHLDLTATRRLMLFAERSGVTVLLLRGLGEEMPSAAATRWRVAAAPSTPLEADAPGAPAFAVDLVKRRGGVPSPGWRLEWDRDAASFRPAPLSSTVAADDGERRVAVA